MIWTTKEDLARLRAEGEARVRLNLEIFAGDPAEWHCPECGSSGHAIAVSTGGPFVCAECAGLSPRQEEP